MENGTAALSDIKYLELKEDLDEYCPVGPPLELKPFWLPPIAISAVGLIMGVPGALLLALTKNPTAISFVAGVILAFGGLALQLPLAARIFGRLEIAPEYPYERLVALLPGSLWRFRRDNADRINSLLAEADDFDRRVAGFEVRESFGWLDGKADAVATLTQERAELEKRICSLIDEMERAAMIDERRIWFLEFAAGLEKGAARLGASMDRESIGLISRGLREGCREFGLDYARLTRRLPFLA